MVGAAVQGRGDIAGEEEGEGKGESEWGEEKVVGVKGVCGLVGLSWVGLGSVSRSYLFFCLRVPLTHKYNK